MPVPLASPDDLAARIGRPLTAAELSRAGPLIADASALVRAFTRRVFPSPVPPDVVAVVCAVVNRTLLSPTMVEGLAAERVGQYGYQFGQFPGGQSPGVAVRLTAADKQMLVDGGWRRRSVTVRVSHL